MPTATWLVDEVVMGTLLPLSSPVLLLVLPDLLCINRLLLWWPRGWEGGCADERSNATDSLCLLGDEGGGLS